MNKEIVDKCMDFCEGRRDKSRFTIRSVKTGQFPQNLIKGNKTEQKINRYLERGLSTREIAKQLEISQPAVMTHIKYYEKGREFYYEWNEFWEFIEPVKKMKLIDVIGDELSEIEKNACKTMKIFTVGDFIMLYAQHSLREIGYMKIRLGRERKKKIFKKLRDLINELF